MTRNLPVLSLHTRIILLVSAALLVALVLTGTLVSWRVEARTRATLAEKAQLVSRLSAENIVVLETLAGRREPGAVQRFTDALRASSGMDYIIVLDMAGNRLTHPNPRLIGDHFTGGDEGAVYRGESYTSVAQGTLGPALRAFTPVRGADGRQTGAVVVGVLLTGIDQHLNGVRRMVLAGILVGFAAGLAGAVLVAGRIKQLLLGMEPGEIASLLQERTAALHTVREGILEEQLAAVSHYAEALRAQTHEFMNKLHVILGLVRLEEFARLTDYLRDISQRFQGEVGQVVRAVKDPVLAGFLLARFSAAREQAITMTLAEDASVPEPLSPTLAHDAITILGNFLENAVDAMEPGGAREIRVSLWVRDGWLTLQVEDSGPGIAPEHLPLLFAKGFSTKGADRGLGLHHAARSVTARGGRLRAENRQDAPGAVFTADVPCQDPEAGA